MQKYYLSTVKKPGKSKYSAEVYRLRAIRSFGDVKAGDMGGWVQNKDNLSHFGNCWVYDEAQICDTAVVSGNAKVSEHATVLEKAKIYGDAIVSGHARIYGKAKICGNDYISNFDRVFDTTYIQRNNRTIT